MNQIKVEQFAILADVLPDNKDIIINTNLSVSYNAEIRSIALNMRFNFEANDKSLILLECRCQFEIAPDDWGKLQDGEKFNIPDYLLEHMAFHTVGTARGILFCKTEGTPFSSIILPPLNVIEIIKQK